MKGNHEGSTASLSTPPSFNAARLPSKSFVLWNTMKGAWLLQERPTQALWWKSLWVGTAHQLINSSWLTTHDYKTAWSFGAGLVGSSDLWWHYWWLRCHLLHDLLEVFMQANRQGWLLHLCLELRPLHAWSDLCWRMLKEQTLSVKILPAVPGGAYRTCF